MSLSGLGNILAVGGRGDTDTTGAVWIFYEDQGSFKEYPPKLVGTNAIGQSAQGKKKRETPYLLLTPNHRKFLSLAVQHCKIYF